VAAAVVGRPARVCAPRKGLIALQPPKLVLAALLAAAAAPVGIALASGPPQPAAQALSLAAPLAGHATLAGQLRAAARRPLLAEHARLARRLGMVGGGGAGAPPAGNDRLRRANAVLQRHVRELGVPIPPLLHRIAACESHGDPRAIGGAGAYRGRYQFALSTWHSVGGTGDPIDASPAEQDRRAAILLARSGPSQWPVCSR